MVDNKAVMKILKGYFYITLLYQPRSKIKVIVLNFNLHHKACTRKVHKTISNFVSA